MTAAMSQPSEPSDVPGVDACASYLKALADPHRLQIIRALQQGAMSVSDIALLLELEIANASHHLRVLYHAQIVTTHKEGKFVYYDLNPAFLKSKAASSFDFGCCKFDLRNLE
ncbi:ArsR family transcriptional regulator [Blastopirellula marina]|uniref:ArsR family transcriptional regulator n=2 Tax=Blastopirellula marina TaxID=124 RepID=A0A2S8GNM3_9BACT|nr:ArsR family transcriptional regulator [Blastopirellula marina]